MPRVGQFLTVGWVNFRPLRPPGCSNINFFSILDHFHIILGSILHRFSIDYEVWKEFVESIEFIGFIGFVGFIGLKT